MRAMLYMFRRSMVNRIRQALHKPSTYVLLAVFFLYFGLIPISFKAMFGDWKLDSPEGLTAVLTLLSFWLLPANLLAYAKRKGVVYRAGDVHFLFPSPVEPKKILLFGHLKTLPASVLMNLIASLICGYIFNVEPWRMVLYFLFAVFIENVLEGGIMLLLYGSERLSEKGRRMIVRGAWALIIVFVAMAVYTYIVHGLSMKTVTDFLLGDMVQMVPVVGWYLAVLHLLFLGPSTVSAVCALLYALLFLVIVAAAYRMKCGGGYYEDAMKFADDYEELVNSRRQGRTDVKFGKKQKFGKAAVTYRGSGAKALFYRQMLEYRKNRFYIFDINTVVSLIAGCFIAYLYVREGGFGVWNDFIIPGVMSYIIFIFTSYNGKWAKEITTPYTFLIPDTPFRKLWYATLMQNIQAVINGCLFTLPAALLMKMSPLTTVLCILFYVVMSAGKLYLLALAQALLGDLLGKTVKQLVQLLLQGTVIGIAAVGAIVGFLLGGVNLAYALMIAMLVAETVGIMAAASINFNRMEI